MQSHPPRPDEPHAPTQAPPQNKFIKTDKTSQQFTIDTKVTQSSVIKSIH